MLNELQLKSGKQLAILMPKSSPLFYATFCDGKDKQTVKHSGILRIGFVQHFCPYIQKM